MHDEIFFQGKKMLTMPEASDRANLSIDYLRRLARRGLISTSDISGQRLVAESSLLEYLALREAEAEKAREELSRRRAAEYGNPAVSNPEPVLSESLIDLAAAAERVGLSVDYIQRLVKRGAIKSRLVSDETYVDSDSLSVFALSRAHKEAQHRGQIKKLREREYMYAHTPLHEEIVEFATDRRTLLQLSMAFAERAVALTLATFLVIGTYSALDPRAALRAAHATESLIGNPGASLAAAAALWPESLSDLAKNFNRSVDGLVYGIAFPDRMVQSGARVAVEIAPYARPAVVNDQAPNLASTNQILQSNSTQTIITQPVTERVVERTIERVVETRTVASAGGITGAYLAEQLTQLEGKLSNQMFALSSANSTTIVQNYGVTAQSNKIDELNDVEINNPTISGGTITGAAISGGSISGVGISANSLNVAGAATFASVEINGNLTIASTTASLSATNATITNATSTNFFATTASSTNLFSTSATSSTFFASTLRATSGTFADLSVTGASSFGGLLSLASTTIGGGTQVSGLTIFGGATTTGNAYFAGGLGIGVATSAAGVLQTSGNAWFGGNLYVAGNSTVIGNSSVNTLAINSSINSHIVPDQNITRDLGSPSFYWRNVYVGNIVANNISAASTTIAGTASQTFTINSDNVSSDAEDADLIFFRGNVVPNALLSWKSDAGSKRFEFNQSLYIANLSGSTTQPTLTLRGSTGQTANIFQIASSTGTNLFTVAADGSVVIATTTIAALTTGTSTITNLSVTNTSTSTFAGGVSLGALAASGAATIGSSLAVAGNTTLANATSTSFFATVASSTNFAATAFTGGTATLGNATSSSFFATTASSTNLFSTSAQFSALSAGTLNVASTIGVSGLATFASGFVSQASSTIVGNFTTTGAGIFGGNLGVGTSSPESSLTIVSSGATAATFFRSALNVATEYRNNVGSMYAGLSTGGNFGIGSSANLAGAHLTVASSTGNLGLGSTTPTSRIGITAVSNSLTPIFTATGFDNDAEYVPFGLFNESNAPSLVLYMKGTTNHLGNIGIGTSTPLNRLTIELNSTNGTAPDGILINDTDASSGWPTDAAHTFVDFGSNDTSGVGGGTRVRLGSIMETVAGTFSRFGVFTAPTTAGTMVERFSVTAAGNVGIGTTSPANRLGVSGGSIDLESAGGAYRIDSLNALYASSTTSSLFVGRSGGSWATATSGPLRNTAVGSLALNATSLSAYTDNTALGNEALAGVTRGSFNTAVGSLALQSLTTGGQNTAQGYYALRNLGTGERNVGIGYLAGSSIGTGSDNVAIGRSSLANALITSTHTRNTAMGVSTLLNASSATNTVAIGYGAAAGVASFYNQGNTAVGYQAGNLFQSTSDYNTLLGYQAGYGITTGSNNIWIGTATSSTAIANLTTGSQNILIGNNISLPSATASGQLNIGNMIFGTGITGNGSTLSTGNLGIGTTTPWARFSVTGSDTSNLTAGLVIADSANRPEAIFTNGGGLVMGTTTLYNRATPLQISAGGALDYARFCREDGSFFCTFFNNGSAAFSQVNTGNGFFSWFNGATLSTGAYTGGTQDMMLRGGMLSVGTSTNNSGTGGHVGIWGLRGFSNYLSITNADAGSSTFGDIFQITSAGRVGIGTSTPTNRLEVAGNTFLGGTIVGTSTLALTGTTGTTTIASGQGFTIGGSQFVLQQGSGNVGIGTTSPASLFSVTGSGYLTGRLGLGTNAVPSMLNSLSVSSVAYARFTSSETNVVGAFGADFTVANAANFGALTNNDVAILTNNAERVRITALGNVGIGTTTPLSTLQISAGSTAATGELGSLLITSDSPKKRLALGVNNDSGTMHSWIQSVENGVIARALALNPIGGNVGIGTTTPRYALYTVGQIAAADSSANNLSLLGAATPAIQAKNYFTDAALPITFWTGTTEKMRLDASGNLGIGTTSPSRKLSVVGADTTGAPTDAGAKGSTLLLSSTGVSANDGGSIEFGAGANNFSQPYFSAIKGLAQNGTSNTIGDLAIYTRNAVSDTSLAERMRITYGGNVGIGTTTVNAKLSVDSGSGEFVNVGDINNGYGAIGFSPSALSVSNYAFSGTAAGTQTLINTNSGGSIGFRVANSEKVTITSAGNVGIGTTPSDAAALLSIGNGAQDPINYGRGIQITNVDGNRQQIAFIRNGNNALSAGYNGASAVWGFGPGQSTDSNFTPSYLSIDQANTRVGIGTTSPVATLAVAGDIVSSANAGSIRTWGIPNGYNTTLVLQGGASSGSGGNIELGRDGNTIYDADTHTLRSVNGATTYLTLNSSSANFGVGILDVGATNKLRISHDGSNASIVNQTTGALTFYNTNAASGFYRFHRSSDNATAFDIQNNGQSLFYYNVGIGNTSPGSLLHVGAGAETLPITPTVQIAASSGSSTLAIAAPNAVGASAQLWLENVGQRNWTMSADRTLDALTIGTGNDATRFLTISSGGNVGIGTTSPSQLLSVAGQVYTTGGIRFSDGTLQTTAVTPPYIVKLAAVYATSTVGTTTVNFAGASGAAPSFSAGALTLAKTTIQIVTEVWGGGGGGGAGNGPAGGTGGTTCFGTNATACSSPTLSATGGGGGAPNGPSTAGSGSGGDVNLTGSSGGTSAANNGNDILYVTGGDGGSAPLGGGGGAGASVGGSGSPGSAFGGGGGGGSINAATGVFNSTGGAGGGYSRKLISNPASSYTFTVGAGGAAGTGTWSGAAGGPGGVVITLYATSSPNAAGNDYAEMFPVSNPGITAADIVAVDTGIPVSMKLAEQGDIALAGVVATNPGHVLGDINAPGERPIALAGRVPVKVNAEGGVIRIGDRIAPSSIPGVGKKANPFDDSIGIAIGPVESGEQGDTVMIFIDLHRGLDVNTLGLALVGSSNIPVATSTEPFDFIDRVWAAITERISLGEDIVYLAGTTTVSELASATSTATSTTPWASAFADASGGLKEAMGSLADTVIHILARAVFATTGIFEKVFAREIITDKLCVADESGQTCITRAQLDALIAGAAQSAGDAGGSGGEGGTGGPSEGAADTTAPLITITGANPATIEVGQIYSDLGAIVSDVGSPNIGISVTVNGGATTTIEMISIDTAAPGTHSIFYSATDLAGNTGTAERIVHVVPAASLFDGSTSDEGTIE